MSLEELSGSDKTNIQPPASADDPDKKHWLEFPGVSTAPSETQPAPAVDAFAAFRLGSSPTLSRTTNDTTIPTLPASQPAAGPLLGPGGAFNFGNLSVDKSKDFSGSTGTNRVIEVQGQDGNSARFLVTQAQKSGPVLESDSVGYTPLDAYGRQLRGTTFITGLTEMRPEVRKAIEAQSFVAPQRTLGTDIASKTVLNSANDTQFPDQQPQPQQRIADLIATAGQPTVAEKTWMNATSSADLVGPTETRPVSSEPIVKAATTGNADPVLPSSLSSADQPVLRSAPLTVPIATTAGVAAANLADKALGSDAAPAVVDTASGIRRTAGVVSDDTTAVGANRITGDTVDAGQRPASLSASKPLTALSGDTTAAKAPLLNDAASAAQTLFTATTTVLSPGNLGLLPTSRDVAPSVNSQAVTGQGTAAQMLGNATRPFVGQKAVYTGNDVTTAISEAIGQPPGSIDRLSPYRKVEVAATVQERGMVYEARRLASNSGQSVIVLPPKETTTVATDVKVSGRPIVTKEGQPVPAYTNALYDQARGYSQPAAGARNLGDSAARTPEARAAFSTGVQKPEINPTPIPAITRTASNNPDVGKGNDTTAGGRPIPTLRDFQNALRQPTLASTTSKDIPLSSKVDPKIPVLPNEIKDHVAKPVVVIPGQGKLISEAIAGAASTRAAAGDLSRGIIRKPDDAKPGTPEKLPANQKPVVRTEAGPTAMAAKTALDKGSSALTVPGKPTERTALSVNPASTTRAVEASRTAIVANKGDQLPTRARLDSGKEAKPGSDSQHMLASKPAVKPNEISTASTRLIGTTTTKLAPEKVTGNGTLGVFPTRTTRAADIAAAKVQPGKGDAPKIEVVKAGDAKSGGIRVAGASDKPVIAISRTLGGEKIAGEGKNGTKVVGPEAKIAGGKAVPVVGATDKGIAATKGGVVAEKGTAATKGGVVADKGIAATKGGAAADKGITEKGADRSIGARLVGSKSGNGVSTLVEGKTITGTRPAASRLAEKTEIKIDAKAIANATRTIGGRGGAADAAKFVVVGDKKAEGKSVSAIKIGSGKLSVSDADVKAIIGTRFGTSKLVTTDKIDIKAISGAKIGTTGKLTLNDADIKALVGSRFGVKIAGSAKGDAQGMVMATGADAKVSSARVGGKSSGKVVISDAAVKAITSPKSISSVKQLSGEKADAKAIPTTGKANKAIATGDTSGKPVSKAELIAGPGGVKGAKTSVGNNVIAEKSNLVKTQPNCLVKAGTERVDTTAPKAARPLDAVAKIFGMAIGTDKADKNSLRDRDSKTEGKDKAVRTDEHVARRIVGNGIQSTEPKSGQRTDGNRDDFDTIKKDAKNTDRVTGSTTRNNQQVSDKLQSWMMQIAEAGLNFGDRRTAKVSQSQKSQNLFKAAGRRRRRYTVRYGDNIRSIARVQLGDERFAQLIITINRGSAGFYMLPDNKTPHLLVDQVIWLPSDAELDIHRKHFFARGTAAGEQQSAPAISVAPEAITVPQVEMEKVTLPEVEIMQGDNTEAYAPPTTISYEQNQQEVASFLQRLRSAGHRQAVSLQDLEGQFDTTEPPQQGDRRVYRVRLGDTLRSIALRDSLMQDQTMWPLLARVNGLSEQRDATTGHPTVSLSRGETVTLPTEEEIKQYRLMNRLASAANNATLCTAETNLLPTESQSNEPKPFIETLSQSCRINSIESESHDAYMTRLEMYINGQWMTVATYDYRHGHAYRYIHRKNGSVAAFPMDLPLEVVRQMSHEDFARNWTTYCIDFATVSPDAVSRSS